MDGQIIQDVLYHQDPRVSQGIQLDNLSNKHGRQQAPNVQCHVHHVIDKYEYHLLLNSLH